MVMEDFQMMDKTLLGRASASPDKIKIYTNRERKGNNKTKWSNNKEKEWLSKKKMCEASSKGKHCELKVKESEVPEAIRKFCKEAAQNLQKH